MHRFAVTWSACTLCLVVAGALITSNDAALSVPDWPLSYGKLMPQMEGGVLYEHGHRMVATFVGMLTIVMAVWLARKEPRPWLRKMGWAALGTVIAQGVLGGMTVLFLLPKPVSISHACLAELFFSMTVAIALFTSEAWKRGPLPVRDPGGVSMRTLATLAPCVVLAQLALGAAARHKAAPALWHIIGAAFAGGTLFWVTITVLLRFTRHDALRRSALTLLTITFAQIFLGIFAYMSRLATADAVQPMPIMVLFTVIHVAVGALTLAFSVFLAIQVYRHVDAPVLAARPAGVAVATR